MRFEDLRNKDRERILDAIFQFDLTDTGYIKSSQLGNLMRYLKLIPTNAQIAWTVKLLDPHSKGVICTATLPTVLAKFWPLKPNQIEKTAWAAFQVFDKENIGKLFPEQLRLILNEIGTEPVPMKEVEKIIHEFMDPKDGFIPIASLIKAWLH
ncbi:unnamed protein product [Calicophoron daubneyi]|uniref:Uncharacterized protein n=1 Tax=Calicophoron daubneyi TaxID=300641 RepID=A0AAV2TRV5_CALDB